MPTGVHHGVPDGKSVASRCSVFFVKIYALFVDIYVLFIDIHRLFIDVVRVCTCVWISN